MSMKRIAKQGRLKVIMSPYMAAKDPYLDNLSSSVANQNVDVFLDDKHGRRRLHRAVKEHGKPDIVHIQWQHPFLVPRSKSLLVSVFRSGFFFLDVLALRRAGVRIVWTVHNIVNHEKRYPRWELFACRILARLVDCIVVHCEAVIERVAESYRVSPDKIRVMPFGHYADRLPPVPDRAEARASLGLPLDAKIFLFFGLIRRYKSVDRLLADFATLPHKDVRLLIVGEPRPPSLGDEIAAWTELDKRVVARLEFVAGDELAVWLGASDAAVLPFSDSLTSGTAIFSASCGRTFIAPAVGCMKEFPDGSAFLYDPDDPDGLRSAMETALSAPLQEMGASAKRYVERYPWDYSASRLIEVYESLAPKPAHGAEPEAATYRERVGVDVTS